MQLLQGRTFEARNCEEIFRFCRRICIFTKKKEVTISDNRYIPFPQNSNRSREKSRKEDRNVLDSLRKKKDGANFRHLLKTTDFSVLSNLEFPKRCLLQVHACTRQLTAGVFVGSSTFGDTREKRKEEEGRKRLRVLRAN